MAVIIIGPLSADTDLLQKFLSKMDITGIHCCITEEEALITIQNDSKKVFELIIYDVNLKSSNRNEIYKSIEILYGQTSIPIILSVDSNNIQELEQAFDIGLFDFIPKPLTYVHFKARVLTALKYCREVKLREIKEGYSQLDMQYAKIVQKHALTPSLETKNVRFDGLNITSNTLGGDMYCWFRIDEHLTAVLLYDVMGHGIASSLVSMSIQSLLKGIITRLIDPVMVLKELNSHVYQLFYNETEMDQFLLTAIYVLIDTKRGNIHYANAAHPSGFLFGQSGETIKLTANTPILGLFPKISVKKKTLRAAKWNRIILYTDGIYTIQDTHSLDPALFYPYLHQNNSTAMENFAEDYELFKKHYRDDITVVSITINL